MVRYSTYKFKKFDKKEAENGFVTAFLDHTKGWEVSKTRVKSTIRKANAMTQEAFAALDLSDTLEVTGL